MSQLDDLVAQIHEQAGFEVYLWSHNSGHLSDLDVPAGKRRSRYVKATHNLRKEPNGSRSCFEDELRRLYQKDISRWDTFDDSGVPIACNVLATGCFEGQTYDRRTICVPRSGFLGALGLKKDEEVVEPRTFPLSLGHFLNNSSDSRAASHVFRATIRVPDTVRGERNRGQAHPALTIVGPEQLIVDLRQYLAEQPGEYQEFLAKTLPAEHFPNVHTGLVQEMLPVDRLLFVDLMDPSYTRVPGKYLERDFAEFVTVS